MLAPEKALVTSARNENLKLLEGFRDWMVNRAFSEHTVRNYGHDARKFVDYIRDVHLAEVNRADISGFLSYMACKGKTHRTAERAISVLKRFFKYLQMCEVIRSNPILLVRCPKTHIPLPTFLSEAQVLQLIEATETLRELALIEFLYATGCRVAEAQAVSIEDINLEKQVVLLRGKGRKERIVPFGKPAREALRKYLSTGVHLLQDGGYLFLRQKSPNPLTVRTLSKMVNTISRRAGLGTVSPHVLRHSCATHMLNRGADIRYIQEMLGHSSLSSTMVYTHVALDELSRVIQKYLPSRRHHAKEKV